MRVLAPGLYRCEMFSALSTENGSSSFFMPPTALESQLSTVRLPSLLQERCFLRPNGFPVLPPEILHEILADMIFDYVDLVITTPLALESSLSTGAPQNDAGSNEDQSDPDGDELPDNFIIPLLSVSYLFRETTLKILLHALDIDRNAEGM